MGLDDHRVTSCQRGEQTGVGVPGRERATTNHQPNASAHNLELFFHDDRWVFALWLFPNRLGRHKALLAPSVGNCLEPSVLCVRAARLKCHHPALARRQHH